MLRFLCTFLDLENFILIVLLIAFWFVCILWTSCISWIWIRTSFDLLLAFFLSLSVTINGLFGLAFSKTSSQLILSKWH